MNGQVKMQMQLEFAPNAKAPISTAKGRPRVWTREKILNAISDMHKDGIVSSHRIGPVLQAAIRQFGSWQNACDAVGCKAASDKTVYTTCVVEDCENKVRSRTEPFCEMHYGRIRRNGTIYLKPVNRRRVDKRGYVSLKFSSNLSQSNGWIYEHRLVLFNKIGSGKHLCHWCGMEVDFDLEYPKDLGALVVDHLDDDKENNSPENLVPSCALCNLKRGNHEDIHRGERWGDRE